MAIFSISHSTRFPGLQRIRAVPGLLLFVAQAAAAQTPPAGGSAPLRVDRPSRDERPYRGLFGGGSGNASQQLIFETSVGIGAIEGTDENPTLGPRSANAGPGQGGMAAGSAKLEYSLSRGRFGLNAGNTTFLDYYAQLTDHKMMTRDIASLSISLAPFKSTHLSVNQGFKDLPELALSDLYVVREAVFGDVSVPVTAPPLPMSQDLAVVVERFRRYGVSLDASQKLSNRLRLDMSVGYARGFVTPGRKWTTRRYSGGVSQSITKGVSLFASYVHGEQRYEDELTANRDRRPAMNFGLDFSKALSFTRRTQLTFWTGTTALEDRVEKQTTYHLIGGTSLTREIARTWKASLSYNRNVRYIEALAEPLLADSLNVDLKGTFSRRLLFGAGFGASKGQLGASTSSSGSFDTYFGSVQASYAFNRYLALGTDYAYHRYSGTLPLTSRTQYPQLLQVYVHTWLPLVNRTKRPTSR